MSYLLVVLTLLLTLPTVGWAGDVVWKSCYYDANGWLLPVQSDIACPGETLTRSMARQPSPCVQQAQKLLEKAHKTIGVATSTSYATEAIGWLLLDHRLGADCTVGEP